MNCRTTFSVLTVLMLSGLLTDARVIGVVKTDLRCKCIRSTADFISPRHMKEIEIIPCGPHCPQVEIIATLKKGRQTCLDPNAPWVKKMVKKISQRKEDC
ncbi:alveolar macrophage chemotactic factor-like [Cetorhinus maximus]